MSAFIVQDETINRILAGLIAGNYECNDYPKSSGQLALRSVEDAPELGAYLFNMNINAIEARYGTGQAGQFRALDYQYESIPPPSMGQLLCSLNCLRYQCSEGEVPETELFQAIDRYINGLTHTIATSTPEYKAAQWD